MAVPSSLAEQAGLLALLWLAGLYLRLPMLVAPPLAPVIGAELALNQSQIGALTTVPVLMLALGAMPGAAAIARLGAASTVALSLVLVALASSARGLAPPYGVLLAATALLGLGVAAMQPALPVLVQRWCPRRLALGSAVYMNGMLMGEFVGGGLTLPWVMPLVDGSWRAALVAWSLPALAIAAAIPLGERLARRLADREAPWPEPPAVTGARRGPWRDPRVWHLGIVLGAASAGFFGTNAYMGSVLAARGESELLARTLLWFNATQVVGSVAMLALGRALVGRRWPVLAAAWGVVLGLAGIGLGGTAVFLPAALLLGLCTCVQLILMVSLVPQAAPPAQAGPLAAGMFAVGYLLGFLVPLGGGALADLTGAPGAAILPMGVLAVAALAVALRSRLVHG